MAGRAVRKSHSMPVVTEHSLENGDRLIVAMNLSPESVDECLEFTAGWTLQTVYYGEVYPDGRCNLPGNDAVVFRLSEP
jgi:hypothetical protein